MSLAKMSAACDSPASKQPDEKRHCGVCQGLMLFGGCACENCGQVACGSCHIHCDCGDVACDECAIECEDQDHMQPEQASGPPGWGGDARVVCVSVCDPYSQKEEPLEKFAS